MDSLERELLDGFDPPTIEQGRVYYARGAVRELGIGQGAVTALVKGGRPHPYVVTIPLGVETRLPDPLEGECTCPVGSGCKHMVATLLAYCRNKAGEDPSAPARAAIAAADTSGRAPRGEDDGQRRQASFDALSTLLDRSKGRKQTVVALRQEGSAPWSRWVSEYLEPRENVGGARRGERWRVVFGIRTVRIADRGLQGGRPQSVDTPVLAPSIQYLRKNGEPGRLEMYQAGRVTEPIDESTRRLLSRILISGSNALLLMHWDYILAHPELPLYETDFHGHTILGEPYRVRRAEHITIGLKPALRESDSEPHVVLRPSFQVQTEDGAGPPSPSIVRWADAWEGRLIVSLGGKVLAWFEAEPRYIDLTLALMKQGTLLEVADAQELLRVFTANPPAGISLDFPDRSARLVWTAPTMQLVVQEQAYADDITVAVHFGYAGGKGAGDGEFVIPIRNPEVERDAVRTLTELFGRSGRVHTTPPKSGSGATALLVLRTSLAEFLKAFGEQLLERGIGLCIGDLSRRLSRSAAPVRILVESGIDWFGLRASAGEEIDLSALDPNDPLFSSGFVRAGGKLLYIGRNETEKLRKVLALLDPDAKGARVPKLDLDALATLESLLDEKPPDLERLLEVARALRAPEGLPEAPPPQALTAVLRSYQLTGYRWLRFLAENGLHGCLADDMGLGKTVQALALLVCRKQAEVRGPNLVVAPVSTLENWRLEAGRFAPTLRVVVHHGQRRPKTAAASIQSADLVVVSYATLRMDAELFAGIDFDTVILDEAQTIKNPLSQSFSVVKRLRSAHRFTLTGTPLENSVIDLWSQMDFLEPGLLGSLSRFRREYGSVMGGERVDRLKRVVRPFILRRTKHVVESSLPAKEEVTLYAEMGTKQAAAYRQIRDGYRSRIAAALKSGSIGGSGALIFEGLLRMRQAACFPAQVDAAYAGIPACKAEVLADVLDEVLSEGHRILVFSQFVESLKEIRSLLETRSTAYAYLDGSTRDRQAVIDRFQRDDGPPVFLISLRAGGVGINLTAADYVVLFDPWWNPAVESQAVDRTHRIGQSKPVFVYRIVTRDSIEEQILELQARKRQLAQDLMDQNPQSLLSLSESEVLELFGGSAGGA